MINRRHVNVRQYSWQVFTALGLTSLSIFVVQSQIEEIALLLAYADG